MELHIIYGIHTSHSNDALGSKGPGVDPHGVRSVTEFQREGGQLSAEHG